MNRASPTYLRKLPAPSLSSPLCVMATSAVRWATTGSSKSWLQRQRNDAWNKGDHRSRAYYKLEQMDAKHAVLSPRPYQRVILDLGCSPGGWAEYAAQFLHREALRTKSSGSGSKQQLGGGWVVGVDLLPTVTLPNCVLLEGDIRRQATLDQLADATQGLPISVVLSDMAPNTMGDKATDHLRSLELCNMALNVASNALEDDGAFLCKVLRGQEDKILERDVRDAGFSKVKWIKPIASRSESKEAFLFASGFKKSS